MALKVILVPVSEMKGGAAALNFAVSLARRFDAHVEALHVRADPRDAMPYMGEGVSGVAIQEIMEATEKEEAKLALELRGLFDSLCEGEEIPVVEAPPGGLSAAWREELGHEDGAVAHRGRLADLIVVSRPEEAGDSPANLTVEAALFESGRPVLIVPPAAPAAACKRVVIAWDGSAEASRAVAHAMPILKEAGEVTALWTEGKDEKGDPGAGDLVVYLAWNGIRARAATLDEGSRSPGAALLAAAKEAKADLLVMGAYTHHRFRRMIFGGATRHVLAASGIPVLMAR